MVTFGCDPYSLRLLFRQLRHRSIQPLPQASHIGLDLLDRHRLILQLRFGSVRARCLCFGTFLRPGQVAFRPDRPIIHGL